MLEQIWEDGCAQVPEEHVGENFMGTSDGDDTVERLLGAGAVRKVHVNYLLYIHNNSRW